MRPYGKGTQIILYYTLQYIYSYNYLTYLYVYIPYTYILYVIRIYIRCAVFKSLIQGTYVNVYTNIFYNSAHIIKLCTYKYIYPYLPTPIYIPIYISIYIYIYIYIIYILYIYIMYMCLYIYIYLYIYTIHKPCVNVSLNIPERILRTANHWF